MCLATSPPARLGDDEATLQSGIDAVVDRHHADVDVGLLHLGEQMLDLVAHHVMSTADPAQPIAAETTHIYVRPQ